jgi:HK97 family phage portal protein
MASHPVAALKMENSVPQWKNALAWLGPRAGSQSREQKASPPTPFVAFHGCGSTNWTPRDYRALAREGYAKNAIVYRAVRMIAESAASTPIVLVRDGREVADHQLLDLLKAPNGIEAGADLFEAWFGHLLLSGNAYLEAVFLEGQPRELYALRPDRVKVIAGVDGWPQGYEYSVGKQTVRYGQTVAGTGGAGLRPILHVKLPHPLNDNYGMSPIEAAIQAIDTHNAASRWNKALLDNSARPSGALVYGPTSGQITEAQFRRLKSELEENYQGSMNAGRPMLLEGGLEWKPLSLTPRDMDFIEAKHAAAREIALALGTPPMLLGIPGDNTYANFREANRTFWRQTVLPLMARAMKAIAAWLGPAYGSNIELRPALDRIEALAPDRAALWEQVQKADFLTINEKRAAIGFGPIDGGDQLAR